MKKSGIWIAAIGLGVTNAVLLYIFEFIGVDVTAWLWNDLLKTNDENYRWFLVPLVAIILSLALSALIKGLGEKRIVPPHADPLAATEAAEPAATPRALGVVLAVGALSLLAGASLGPEAALMAASTIIGLWVTNTLKLSPVKEVIVLASIGALLVAFLGSILMAIVPLILLLQKRQLKVKPAAIILLTSLVSYATILFIDPKDPGYGTAPVMPPLEAHDYWVALAVGFIASLLALGLNWSIKQFSAGAKFIDKKTPWYVSATLFGLVLGGLYLIGGQTIQFSGNIGSGLLVSQAGQYGAMALIVMILAKMLATSWSTSTGYRGGLVFPSIYMGVALGLLTGVLFPELGGAGAMIGGIAGVISATLGSPVIAGLFVFAILPPGPLMLVALCAIIGTVSFSLLKKVLLSLSQKSRYAK